MHQQRPRQRQTQQNVHPIFKAIFDHKIDDVKGIIKNDLDGSWKKARYQRFLPIPFAAARGNVEMVKFLLNQAGMDVNDPIILDYDHLAILAIQHDNVDVVAFLLQRKDEIVNQGGFEFNEGDTYLPYTAVRYNSPKALDLLLKTYNIKIEMN